MSNHQPDLFQNIARQDDAPAADQWHLFLGAGHSRLDAVSGIRPEGHIVALDLNLDCMQDGEIEGESFIQWDLETYPWPFLESSYSVIHAYEVLEHLGHQGNFTEFFRDFEEIWRILKPGGELRMTCPRWDNLWAWGDPGHRRIINEGTLSFLSQESYEECDTSPRTDYRRWWKGDFAIKKVFQNATSIHATLEAIKP